MTYKLAFNESALKEWKKLGHTIQEQFKKKLRERFGKNPSKTILINLFCLVLQINIWFIIVLSLKQITSPSLI